jgi:AcrR family transcriptional regulator
MPAADRKPARTTAKSVRTTRAQKSAAKREAILAAALDEFTAKGYAAARLDDVARRAGVAKGTIYVHFRDKETLFEQLIRSSLSPIVDMLTVRPAGEVTVPAFCQHLVTILVREVMGTRRKDVLRLVITEGQRFPELAHIYYRAVVSRALPVLRSVVRAAYARGEIDNDVLGEFPQLVVAPALMWLIWDALFARFEPLDLECMMQAHLDLLFRERRAQ